MTEDPKAPAGWHPDPHGSDKLRYWDGQQWTQQVKVDPAKAKKGMPNSLKWAIGIGGVLLIIIAIADSGSDDSEEPAKAERPGIAAPVASGSCPGQMFVGMPVELNFKVKNPGKVPYPATYFTFWDGSGPFVINSGSSDGAPGIEGDYGLQGGFQFRGILKPSESRNVRLLLTPKDAGNFDELKFGTWGGKEDSESIPDNASLLSCEDIAINP